MGIPRMEAVSSGSFSYDNAKTLNKQELGGGVWRGSGKRARTCSLGAGIDGAQDGDAEGQVQGRWVCFKNFIGSYHVPSLSGCGWKRTKTAGQRS